ncbi:hypothetical protein B0H19DRAFT_1239769 [Mycena capillaripes]|nr:hypothetical protein B0H19DRAFT_1239769 [Mycena capillaripes]
MPEQASETPRVQYIYGGTGGTGGRGGEMGGAGGSGEGPIWESHYYIKTETFNMNNHWHLDFDGAALDRVPRQMADSGAIGGGGDFGFNFPRRPQSFAGFADDITVAAVSMLMRKPSFDSLAQPDFRFTATSTPGRKLRLSAASPPDPVSLPTHKPTFDSLVHKCPGADYATTPLVMPMPTPSSDCPIPERRAADSAHPPMPPAAARPTSPPVLDYALTPPPHPPILPTHPHPVRLLLHSLGLRRNLRNGSRGRTIYGSPGDVNVHTLPWPTRVKILQSVITSSSLPIASRI